MISAFESKLNSPLKRKDNPNLLKFFPSIKEEGVDLETSPSRKRHSVNVDKLYNRCNLRNKLFNSKILMEMPLKNVSPVKKNIIPTPEIIEDCSKDINKDSPMKYNRKLKRKILERKYFILQLKKVFLQAKKYMFFRSIMYGKSSIRPASVDLNLSTNIIPINKSTLFGDILPSHAIIQTAMIEFYENTDEIIKINNYILYKNKLLGKGKEFSKVFLAKGLIDGIEYAVKIVDRRNLINENLKRGDNLKEELQLLKKIINRYIVKTYEIIQSPNECIIVMEHMQKNSLLNNIEKLDNFLIWKYFRNLICAVEYCIQY
jgi:hypothetical protein